MIPGQDGFDCIAGIQEEDCLQGLRDILFHCVELWSFYQW